MLKNTLVFAALAALALGAGCKKDKDKDKPKEAPKPTPTTTKPTDPGAAKPGDHRRHMRDPAARAAMMKTRLGLNDEQAKKIEEIYKSGERGPERADKIKAVLEPEQLKKWEQMRAMRRGMRDPAARMKRMQATLGLDADQMKKMEELHKSGVRGKERMEKMKAILKPEQLKKWEEHRAKWRERAKMRREGADGDKPADKPAEPDKK